MIKYDNREANEIKEYICSKLGFTMEQLNSYTKPRELSEARSIGMYLTCYQCGQTSTSTARAFKRKQHFTVQHAVERVKGLIETDLETRLFVERALIDLGI